MHVAIRRIDEFVATAERALAVEYITINGKRSMSRSALFAYLKMLTLEQELRSHAVIVGNAFGEDPLNPAALHHQITVATQAISDVPDDLRLEDPDFLTDHQLRLEIVRRMRSLKDVRALLVSMTGIRGADDLPPLNRTEANVLKCLCAIRGRQLLTGDEIARAGFGTAYASSRIKQVLSHLKKRKILEAGADGQGYRLTRLGRRYCE